MEHIDSLVENVLIAYPHEDIRREIRAALPRQVNVWGECDSCEALRRHYRRVENGLIISGVSFDDGDALETLAELSRNLPQPAVIVTTEGTLEAVERALRDHVMAYMLLPIDPGDLLGAMVIAKQRHEQLMELQAEVKDLRQALEDRRVIERAKGMLMGAHGLSELEAYVWLRSKAQEQRRRIVEVAHEITDERDEPRN